MAQNDLIALTARGQLALNDVVNTWGFIQKSTTAGFQGQALIDAWQAGAQASYLQCFASTYTLVVLSARKVFPVTNELVEETLPGGTVGGQVVEATANQTAAVLSWRTALAGRSFRGRSYMGAVPESMLSAGLINTNPGQTQYNAFISNMLVNFGPSGTDTNFQFGIISRFNGGVERPNPIFTPVTVGLLRLIPGVQRRRRVGVGS